MSLSVPHSLKARSLTHGVIVASLLATALTSAALAAGTAPRVEDIQIIQVIQKFNAARDGFDASTLRQITADTYIEVSPAGEVIPRGKILDLYSSAHKTNSPENESSEYNVRLFGDTGVVVSRLAYDLKASEQPAHHIDLRVTYVVKRSGGDWKLISAQYTPISSAWN
ncbi:MAG TPA: nuclear transport factor 2 family protein [Candidatus Aquilonibacter sp.]|nr:nuclear transport factor 2 family protein [Candidatus Aquilonibacter sp.]